MNKAQKNINRVCEYRQLPEIEVGQLCRVSGLSGKIVNGNRSCNFQVMFDESGEEFNCHPGYKMTIYSKKGDVIIFDSGE